MPSPFVLSLSNRALFALLRQPDAERRSARLTFHLNLPLMLFDDFLANIKAEAAPFARRFRGEERLEDARLDLVGNAAAGIGDFDDDSCPTPSPSQEGS